MIVPWHTFRRRLLLLEVEQRELVCCYGAALLGGGFDEADIGGAGHALAHAQVFHRFAEIVADARGGVGSAEGTEGLVYDEGKAAIFRDAAEFDRQAWAGEFKRRGESKVSGIPK